MLHAALRGLLAAAAPIAPHTAEDAWLNLPFPPPAPSAFQAGWPAPDPAWGGLPPAEAAAWEALLAVREATNAAMERARVERVLGASLEAAVTLHASDPGVAAALAGLQASGNGVDELRFVFIVSSVTLAPTADAVRAAAAHVESVALPSGGEVTVGVSRAGGSKCARCWNYSGSLGGDGGHPELCERCTPVIRAMGFKLPHLAPA